MISDNEKKEEKQDENNDVVNETKKDLKEILRLMDLPGEIEQRNREEGVELNIVSTESENNGLLVGKRGKTLSALQLLVNRMVSKKTGSFLLRVFLDVEGYRARREEMLRSMAGRLAEKVVSTRKKCVLEPMEPADRRIIHLTLQDNKEVETYSEGSDFEKTLVIAPAGEVQEAQDQGESCEEEADSSSAGYEDED